ncbi:hypothetical protein PC116_g11358 [Phytophthora cactorum]|nr:hypothetical protein PC116_g11358 [Phytophthora cactorum]
MNDMSAALDAAGAPKADEWQTPHRVSPPPMPAPQVRSPPPLETTAMWTWGRKISPLSSHSLLISGMN